VNRSTSRVTPALAALTALTILAVAPASAAAAPGSVAVGGRTLTFQAGAATTNDITIGRIFPKPFYWGVQDTGTGATVVTGTGCHVRTRSAYPFECDSLAAGEINRVRIFAGSLDDKVDVDAFGGSSTEAHVVISIFGGLGNDTVTGGPEPDVISVGPGVNVAKGADGNDRLLTRNGTRDTLVDCGPGIDTAVIDRLDRPIGCEHVLRAA
jgi:hypothetical protein